MHRRTSPSDPNRFARSMPRAVRVWLCAVIAGIPLPALAWTSPAPDVVVYAQRSLGGLLQAAAAGFQAARGVHVHVFLNSSDGLLGLVRHGARADVVVADTATLDPFGALLVPGSRVTVGLDRWVLVAPAAARIAPGQAAAQLIATHAVVVSDATSAASFDGRHVLQAIAPAATPLGAADAPDVVFTVLHDSLRLGLVHASDVGEHGKLVIVSSLPDTPPSIIQAAALTGGQSGQAAAFVRFLTDPAHRAIVQAGGLETP